jgi:hypothetical protein
VREVGVAVVVGVGVLLVVVGRRYDVEDGLDNVEELRDYDDVDPWDAAPRPHVQEGREEVDNVEP